MKRLLRGGTVVSAEGQKKQDVLIDGEKILAVGENLDAADAEVTDVTGRLIFPGFIDAHTHMALEVSGTITADKFDTGTKAELVGGTTCIIDFATQERGETLSEALAHWHAKADGQSSCDYAFHMAIGEWNEAVSREMEEIVKGGISSFKVYLTYDNRVDDQTLYEILTRVKELGGLVGVHCENHGIIQARLAEVLQEKGNRLDVSDYPWTRPAEAEAEAVARLLKIAKCVDTPVIVVHLSTAAGYREIERARAEGQTVYVETCPQYLVMDDSRYSLPDGRGRLYMIAPPLRKTSDQEVLWQALSEDQLQTIATDHCSFTPKQKLAGEKDFSKTPCGMPGAQERPMLIWQYGVSTGRLTAEQMCRYLSENPAKQYHLYPRKGVIAPGSDADIVVWNPQEEWTLSAHHQLSAAEYCPLEGTKIRGMAEKVFLRGELAAEDGKILRANRGIYIKH
ncbi:MAG: dihydropyrimidinase [Lachnospiraceae bacterium]|nr:dihydropyrimidinase [Lachnospiraceae bacterium]